MAGCGPAHLPTPSPDRAQPVFPPKQVEIPRHEFLLDGHDENVRAPMYGYVLMGPDTQSPDAGQQRLALARSVWQKLARPGPELEPGPRGVSVWLVRGLDRQELQTATVNQDWQVWLDHYHYQRAQMIYDRVGLAGGPGPHIVTALEPLGRLAGAWQPRFQAVLVLDISGVPAGQMAVALERYRQHILENPVQRTSAWRISALAEAYRDLWGAEAEARFSIHAIPD